MLVQCHRMKQHQQPYWRNLGECVHCTLQGPLANEKELRQKCALNNCYVAIVDDATSSEELSSSFCMFSGPNVNHQAF